MPATDQFGPGRPAARPRRRGRGCLRRRDRSPSRAASSCRCGSGSEERTRPDDEPRRHRPPRHGSRGLACSLVVMRPGSRSSSLAVGLAARPGRRTCDTRCRASGGVSVFPERPPRPGRGRALARGALFSARNEPRHASSPLLSWPLLLFGSLARPRDRSRPRALRGEPRRTAGPARPLRGRSLPR